MYTQSKLYKHRYTQSTCYKWKMQSRNHVAQKKAIKQILKKKRKKRTGRQKTANNTVSSIGYEHTSRPHDISVPVFRARP
jgi:hypothetical protein